MGGSGNENPHRKKKKNQRCGQIRGGLQLDLTAKVAFSPSWRRLWQSSHSLCKIIQLSKIARFHMFFPPPPLALSDWISFPWRISVIKAAVKSSFTNNDQSHRVIQVFILNLRMEGLKPQTADASNRVGSCFFQARVPKRRLSKKKSFCSLIRSH